MNAEERDSPKQEGESQDEFNKNDKELQQMIGSLRQQIATLQDEKKEAAAILNDALAQNEERYSARKI